MQPESPAASTPDSTEPASPHTAASSTQHGIHDRDLGGVSLSGLSSPGNEDGKRTPAEQLAADSLTVAAADVAGTSQMLERGLEMSTEERRAHIRRLRASVRNEDLAWWLARQLRDLAAVASGGRPPSRALLDTVRGFNPELRS